MADVKCGCIGRAAGACTKLSHTREREKYFIVYTLELKRQQLFPVVAGLFAVVAPKDNLLGVLPFILMKLAQFFDKTTSFFNIYQRIFVQ